MAKLYFRIGADFDKVIKLREEISKLKNELKNMDSTQSPAAFKTLNTQLAASTQRMDELVTNAAKAGAVMEGDFKKKIFTASQSVNGFTEKIIAQKAVVKDVEADVKRLGEAYRIVLKRNPLSADGKLREYNSARKTLDEEKAALFGLTQEQANARLSVSKLRQEYALYKDDSVKLVSANDDIVGSMKQFILTIAGAGAIKSFISNVVEVTGNFQKMEAVLGNTLGSTSKAKETMDMLADFGAKTPFQVDELTSAYVKLANQGFTPTMDQMKKLGDLASSTGKSFDQLAEAIIDAQVGENERLKEFGIRASKNGDKVTYTFKEQETTIQNTASAIREYILSLGDLEGVIGANEKISATFVGRLSNIQDELTNKLKNFGEQFNTELSGGINAAGLLVENLNSIIPVIGGLVAAYGSYKAAVIAVNAAHKAGALFDNIRLISMMRKELGLVTAAQKAFNTASKANIYATLISVLIGLGTAVYMFTKKVNEAIEANNSLSRVNKNASEEYAKQASSIDRLTGFLKSETASLTLKRDKLKELKGLIPGYNAELNEEGKLINNNTEAIKAYLVQLEKQIKLKAAQEELEELYRKKRLQEKDIKAKQENADREKNNVPEVVYGGDSGIEAQRLALSRAADAENALKQANAELKITETNIEQIQKEIEDTSLSTLDNKSAKTQNKAFWEKQKKAAETVLESIASSQKKLMDAGNFKGIDSNIVENYKKNSKLLKEAEKELGVYGSYTKQENQAEKLRQQNEKLKILTDKQAREQSRAEADAANKIEQLEIDRLKDGGEKTLKQRELNHKKELEAIEREAEDKKQKVIDEARTAFEANPDNKKKSFSVEDFIKSEPTKKKFAVIDNVAKENKTTSETKYNRGDDLTGLLSEYQDYTDKRLAIEKKFNDDLAVLDEQRKVAVEKGDTKQVEQINRSIAQATKDKGKSLMGLDYDKLKQSPEYVRAFENLKQTSTETLDSLLSQFEKAKQTAAQVLSPDQLREYTTTIQSIMDELDERNPFQALADRQKELADAENELAEAKRQLDLVNGGGKIVTGVKNSKLENGKISFENTYLSSADALKKYNEAKDKAAKASNRYQKAEKEVADVVDKLFTSIKDVGSTIGGTSGEVLSFIGDIGLFVTSSINAWETAASAGSKAVQAVEKASVILAVISTVIQLMEKLSSLSKSAYEQYEAFAEKVKEINLLTDAVNEYRIAALEAQQVENNWFSKDNLQNLRDYRKLHEEVAKAYKDKAEEDQATYQNQKGGGWLTGGLNGIMNWLSPLGWSGMWQKWTGQNYDEGISKAVDNLRIETRKKSKGFLGTGIGSKSQKTEDLASWIKKQKGWEDEDLFDEDKLINAGLAKEVIEKFGDKLVGQTKETLEALIDLREQYDEYLDQLHEYVSSLYEPLVDNVVDSLWDWLDTGKDALDSFKDYASDTFRDIVSDMMRSIVLSKVVDGFDKQVSDLYEKYAKGDIDEQELMKQVAEKTGELMDRYEQNMPTLQDILGTVNGYFKDAGIDLKDKSANSQSSSKAVSVMASQDSIDETNGRLTGIQMAGEEIKVQNASQSESLNILTVKADAILSVNTDTRNIADEIRTIQVNSYLELQEIRENTGNSAKYLKDIKADMAEVKKNTSGLNSR